MNDPLMEIRTALTTTTNTVGSLVSGTAVELQHRIDSLIADTINRDVDLRPLIDRKPTDQLHIHWDIRTDLGSTSKAAVYSDGGTGTPYPSTKKLMTGTVISYRSDYEVTGLMSKASASFYDALADETACALDELKLFEEKMMICGSDTNAYGVTSGFSGLLQLMRWYQTNGGDTEGTAANKMGDTTAVFGWTRGTTSAAASAFTDVSYVIAGTAGTATGVFTIDLLDKAITLSNKHGGKDHEKVFFCSEERCNEINQSLQSQQRFNGSAGLLNIEGGFTVTTYRGIPIIGSRYMDKNGATNTSTWNSSTDADNSMYLLDLDLIEMRILGGVDATHVLVNGEVSGTAGYNRADAFGGYFKIYALLVFKAFNPHVHICNLTVPA